MNLLDSGLGTQLRGGWASFKKGVQEATRDALGEAGAILRDEIRAELIEQHTTPSAPGEPPAAQTLELYRSIGMQWRRTRDFFPRLRVGSGHIKARFLEFGTFKMRPRPFMRPAFRRAESRMGDVAEIQLRRRGTKTS